MSVHLHKFVKFDAGLKALRDILSKSDFSPTILSDPSWTALWDFNADSLSCTAPSTFSKLV